MRPHKGRPKERCAQYCESEPHGRDCRSSEPRELKVAPSGRAIFCMQPSAGV